MKLSSDEKQSLLGPLVVGCLVGAFVAYAAVAFNSEFQLQGIPVSILQFVCDALLGFLLPMFATVGLVGVLPMVIHRRRGKRNGTA